MEYVYCVESRKRPTEVPQLGIRCDEAEIPYPIDAVADDVFSGMTQLVHSRPSLDQSGEPIRVGEELRGLFAACVFGRKLAVIVRPGSAALPSRWFVLDLVSVDVSPGVWLPGVFKRPPGSVIIEAADLTMKVVDPVRHFITGESLTGQSVSMIDSLRRTQSPHWGVAGGAGRNLDDPDMIAEALRWPFPWTLDEVSSPVADIDEVPPPQVTGCE